MLTFNVNNSRTPKMIKPHVCLCEMYVTVVCHFTDSMQFLWRTGTPSTNLQPGRATDILSAGLPALMKWHPRSGLVEMKVLVEKKVTGSWWCQRTSNDLIGTDPEIIPCRTVALGPPIDPSLRSLPIHTLPSRVHLKSLPLCKTH